MTTKTCSHCHSLFTSNFNAQKFCNPKCRSASYQKREHWKKPHSKLSVFKSSLRKYGFTLEDYEMQLQNHNYRCSICCQPETELYLGTLRKLSVDHNHKTGCYRGLLCGRCNKAIGLFKDDIAIIKQAVQYLEKNRDPRDNT